MTYLELIGVPASGKTTKALKLIRENKYLYPGRKSLKYRSKLTKISQIGFPSEINPLRLLINLPEDIFFLINFLFVIKGGIKAKIFNAIKMFYLIQKSRALRISKFNFVLDQGILQFLMHCYFKHEISLKNAQNLVSKISKKNFSAEKYIFISCSLEEMQFRINQSKKHLKQLKNQNIKNYCENYIKAFKKLNFEKILHH